MAEDTPIEELLDGEPQEPKQEPEQEPEKKVSDVGPISQYGTSPISSEVTEPPSPLYSNTELLQQRGEASRFIRSIVKKPASITEEELEQRRTDESVREESYSLVDYTQDVVRNGLMGMVYRKKGLKRQADTSFTWTEKLWTELTHDLPQNLQEEFEDVGSEAEARALRKDMDLRIAVGERLAETGGWGTVGRFAIDMADPLFFVGLGASSLVAKHTIFKAIGAAGGATGLTKWGNKAMELNSKAGGTINAGSLYAGGRHMGKHSLNLGLGMTAITAAQAYESPVVSDDDLPAAFLGGAAFGGVLGALGIGYKNLKTRVHVPKEAHRMNRRHFEQSKVEGEHRDHVIEALEKDSKTVDAQQENVLREYYEMERGLAEKPVTDAIFKHRGEEGLALMEAELVSRSVENAFRRAPETVGEFTIREFGRVGMPKPITWKEARENGRKYTEATREHNRAKREHEKLEAELATVEGAGPSKALKDAMQHLKEARRRVDAAKKKVRAAEKSIEKFDKDLDALIKDIKTNPKKYSRLFKEKFEHQMIPFRKRIVGGHGKKTAHRYHQEEFITDLNSLLLALGKVKTARKTVLTNRSKGSKAAKREMNALKEATKKLEKILNKEQMTVINKLVKNSEAIKGRRHLHLIEETGNLTKATLSYLNRAKVTDRRAQVARLEKMKILEKLEKKRVIAERVQTQALKNLRKLDPIIALDRKILARLKKRMKEDIEAGRRVSEALLRDSRFSDVVRQAEAKGLEIKNYSESTRGVLDDIIVEPFNKLTPKGEAGPHTRMPTMEPKAQKVFDALLNPLRHLSKKELQAELRKRGIQYSTKVGKNTKKMQEMIREHDLVEIGEDYKGMGSLIKVLKKGGFKFKTKGDSREARTAKLKEYREAVRRAFDRYAKEQQIKERSAVKEQQVRERRDSLTEAAEATGEKVEREVVDTTPPEPVSDSVAMGFFDKAATIAWAPIRKWFGKVSMSFTAEVGTLETHGALRFIAGEVLQDSMARVNPVTGMLVPVKMTATSKAKQNTDRMFVDVSHHYATAQKAWAKKNSTFFDATINRTEELFGEEVSKVLRGVYKGNDPHVLEAAKQTRKVIKAVEKRMVDSGLIEKPFDDPNYFPRKIETSKVIKAIKEFGTDREYGDNKLADELIAPAIRDAHAAKGPEFALTLEQSQFLGRAWLRNVHKRGTHLDYNSNGFLAEHSADTLTDYLKSIKVGESDIKAILEATRVSKKSNSVGFLRHRLLMNEGFSAEITNAKGETKTVRLLDFFDNNTKRVMWSFVRRVNGAIEWRDVGLKFNEARGLSNKANPRPATTAEMWDFIQNDMGRQGRSIREIEKAHRALERMEASVKGFSIDGSSELATVSRVLQKISGAVYSGPFGIAGIAEAGQPLAHSSLKAFMTHSKDLGKMVKDFQQGKLSDSLSREIAILTGVGTEGSFMREIATLHEHYPMGRQEHLSAFENFVGNAQNKVLMYGGLIPLDAIQRRYASKLFVQHFLDSTISGKSPYTVKRLLQLGLTPQQGRTIQQMLKKHASYEKTGNHKLKLMNVDKWEGAAGRDAARSFGEAIFLHTQKVIHQSHTGNVPAWLQNPIARTLFQFRYFGIGSLETQLLANLQAGDRRAVSSFMMNTFFGMISYMGIMANKYGHDPEKLAEYMTMEELVKGAITRSGYYASTGSLFDTALPLLGFEPLGHHARGTSLTTGVSLDNTPVGATLLSTAKAFQSLAGVVRGEQFTQTDGRNFRKMEVGQNMPLVSYVNGSLINMLPEKEED